MFWSDFGDVRPHMIGGWSLSQAVGHLSQQIGSASKLRGCSSLSDGVRHCLDMARFLPLLSGIGNNHAQSLALWALWIWARCSFVGSVFRSGFLPRKSRVFSALIGLSLWTTTAGGIGRT